MNKKFLVGYKVVFALLGFSAIITELATLVDRSVFDAGNFFSYFTIESNILAVIALLVGAFVLYAGKKSRRVEYFRGAVTFYMVMTGTIFAVLLAGIENASLTAVPWDNTVLHYILPIAVAADWLMDRPSTRFKFRQALAWVIFPILYLIYSLFRGAVITWYPYPFLDPVNGGYLPILITSLIITVGSLAMIYLINKVGRKSKKHS